MDLFDYVREYGQGCTAGFQAAAVTLEEVVGRSI